MKNFKITEMYDFPNRPLLFACRNEFGGLFFILCVDFEWDLSEIWLYAPASESRFQSVKKGETELRRIFTDAEGGFVFQVKLALGQKTPVSAIKIKCDRIPDMYLPKPGEFIFSSN